MSVSPQEAILSARGLTKEFFGFTAVNSVDLDVRENTIHALIGPNGAGKTTVFNCITGFYKPTMGMITMRQQDGETHLLERLPDFEITKKRYRVEVIPRTLVEKRFFSDLLTQLSILESDGAGYPPPKNP